MVNGEEERLTFRQFCSKHKLVDGMSLIAPQCQHSGCTTLPNYGGSDGNRVFCGKHKLEGMSRIGGKTAASQCRHSGCTTTANYGLTASGKRLYCAKHKSS